MIWEKVDKLSIPEIIIATADSMAKLLIMVELCILKYPLLIAIPIAPCIPTFNVNKEFSISTKLD